MFCSGDHIIQSPTSTLFSHVVEIAGSPPNVVSTHGPAEIIPATSSKADPNAGTESLYEGLTEGWPTNSVGNPLSIVTVVPVIGNFTTPEATMAPSKPTLASTTFIHRLAVVL